MRGNKKTREELIAQDAQDLKKLGYAQQLFREMGGFSNFAISFSIISILTGAVLLFGYGLKFAGPVVNSVGWPIVSLFTLAVAASMAELASAYPTAGGLYFWAYKLGGRGWAWITAWFNMIGQVTITAGINIAAATYLIGFFVRAFSIPDTATVPIFGSITSWYFQVFVMVLLTVPQVLINIYGIKLTARLSNFSVYWHIGGVAVIALLLVIFGKYHNPFSFLFTHTVSVSPLAASSAEINGVVTPALAVGEWKAASPLFSMFSGLKDLYGAAPFLLVFVLALLQAQWTYTGFDASAHAAEETVMARKNSAWGVFLSVAVSAVVGYILLMILTWCIPRGDVTATAKDAYPVLYIAYENLPAFMGHVVSIIIGGAMWLCGCSSITSMGRMWYAFARDDGMPGSSYLKQVSPTYRTPIYAILITTLLAIVLTLYAAAHSVITSISTIALYVAYVIPIWLNFRNRRTKRGEFITEELAPWNLGRWSGIINLVAIVWSVLIIVVFSLPPNELVLWTFLGMSLLLLAYWLVSAKANFPGPKTTPDAVQQLEKQMVS